MANLLKQFGPVGIVLAMAIWCCWGYLTGETGFLLDEVSKTPTLDANQMRPVLIAGTTRDPFVARAIRPKELEVVSDLPMKSDDRPSNRLLAGAEMMTKLRLDATFQDGERRVAVINRKVFHEGDKLVHETFPSLRVGVTAVQSDHVVLSVEGHSYALYYPDFGRTRFTRLDEPASEPSESTSLDASALRLMWSIGRALSGSGQPLDRPHMPALNLGGGAPISGDVTDENLHVPSLTLPNAPPSQPPLPEGPPR